MQHPSGAAGSCSRSLPACPNSVCPVCCGTCGRACCGAWHHSPAPVPSQATRQPRGTRVFVVSLLPRENDHWRQRAGGRGGRHSAFGAARLEGSCGRGLGTAGSGTDPEGLALARCLEGRGVVPTATTFFFECLCSDSWEGLEEEGPINICITPRRKRKRFYILQLTIIHNWGCKAQIYMWKKTGYSQIYSHEKPVW